MLQDGVEYLDLNPRVVQNKAYFSSLSGSGDNLGKFTIFSSNESIAYISYFSRSFYIKDKIKCITSHTYSLKVNIYHNVGVHSNRIN